MDKNSVESEREQDDPKLEQPHPLHQMPILVNIIEHLDSDKQSLKVFRKVCTTWNNAINFSNIDLPILIKSNLNAFNALLSQPQAKLCCRKVTLGANLDLGIGQFLIFLENQGHEIQKLKAKGDIIDLSLLFLPKFCPNLVKLSIQPNFSTSDFQIPNLLKQTWENPFPHLKYLTIRLSIAFRIQHTLGGGSRPFPLNYLTTMTNITTFLMFFLTKALKLKQLSLVNWDGEVWQSITNALTHRPEIVENLQRIEVFHLNFLKFKPNHIESLGTNGNPSLNLKILEIQEIPGDMKTEMFSKLLQNLAPTLKVLRLKSNGHNSNYWPHEFRLIFPCVMKSLKSLEIKWKTMIPTNICSGSEDGNDCNLFHVLPNLQKFSEKHSYVPHLAIGGKDFWETVFPESWVDDGFVQNALVQLESSCIIPFQFVEKLALCFPKLSKCFLKVNEGTMLEVVTKLNGCEISSLCVMYYSWGKGLNGLFSAISGISFEDCMNYDALVASHVEVEKTSTSLADWKALRHLTILYRGSSQDLLNREPIKTVCIEGFAQSTQLRKLAIKGFQMDSTHIAIILDNIPLQSFDFNYSTGVMGSPEQGDTNNIEALRNQYPGVILNGGFAINRGDWNRFKFDPEDEEENYEDGF